MGLFGKPFRVKSNTQLKGSDKKKLKAQILSKFSTLTEDDINSLLPTKEEIILSKIYTYGGDSVILYLYKRDAVFFQLEKHNEFYPTVYTMWRFPKIVPVFTTHVPVLSKLMNGADLMLPGVIIDESKGIRAYCDGKLQKSDVVAINLENNLAPVAVGKAFRSSEDMYMAVRHGKAIDVLHCVGDELWGAGTRVEVPSMGPPDLPANIQEYKEEAVAEEENEISNTEESSVNVDDVEEIADKTESLALNNETSQPEQELDLRTDAEKMDEFLLNAFLQAWKTSAKKIELPILTSNFFRLHMVPNSPPGVVLDPKKSSYKKISKFLAQQEKLGLIKVKELQKGVESIMSVDVEHETIKYFRVVKYEKVEEVCEENIVLPCDKDYEPPQITELRMVNANVSKLFSLVGVAKGDGLLTGEVREHLVKYIKDNELQHAENKALVRLDPILAEIVLKKGENNVLDMKWDEINSRLINKMGDGYALIFPGYKPQKFKGKLEPIDLRTATRSGNKKVTLVTNLEVFGIDPNKFAHKCQVSVAASTSVYAAANKKSGWEVLVQGNQLNFITKLLLQEYKIPRKYVKSTEPPPKKKK